MDEAEGCINGVTDLPLEFFRGFLTGKPPDDYVVNGNAAIDLVTKTILVCKNSCPEEQYPGNDRAEDDNDQTGKCVGTGVSFFHKYECITI